MREYCYVSRDTVANTFVNLPEKLKRKLSQTDVLQVLNHRHNYLEMYSFRDSVHVSVSSVCNFIKSELTYEGVSLSKAIIRAVLEAEEDYYTELGLDS